MWSHITSNITYLSSENYKFPTYISRPVTPLQIVKKFNHNIYPSTTNTLLFIEIDIFEPFYLIHLPCLNALST